MGTAIGTLMISLLIWNIVRLCRRRRSRRQSDDGLGQNVELQETKDKPELAAEWRHELASPGTELEGSQCISPLRSETTTSAVDTPARTFAEVRTGRDHGDELFIT